MPHHIVTEQDVGYRLRATEGDSPAASRERNKPMDMTELIGPEQVISLSAAGKPQLLQELARRAAKSLGIEARAILDAVLTREALGSTGVGHGIAVPHARVAGLARLFSLFARLEKPIDFAAVDGRPVDLVFLLLIPANAEKEHLAALASVSRCLRNGETARRLRATAEPHALYSLLAAAASGDAAPPSRT